METKICTVCGGNDKDIPCAYPGDGREGCLRDERLSKIKYDEMRTALQIIYTWAETPGAFDQDHVLKLIGKVLDIDVKEA